MRAVRVRVSGQVQGVFYRGWTRDEAEALGLRGWVRNERDGSVAALLVGPDAQVEAMLAAMRRGPPDARVADVAVAAAEAEPTAGFEIRH
jgi:acylphosphatase